METVVPGYCLLLSLLRKKNEHPRYHTLKIYIDQSYLATKQT
jgi:hypothetical protein